MFSLIRGSHVDRNYWLQILFNLLPVWLEERGKGELLTKVLRILVSGETGAVGGNLEEHSSWLPEVDRVKVEAIYNGSH